MPDITLSSILPYPGKLRMLQVEGKSVSLLAKRFRSVHSVSHKQRRGADQKPLIWEDGKTVTLIIMQLLRMP